MHLRVTDLYAEGSFDPDHDAVMRIGGEAPGGGPILSVSISARFEYGVPAGAPDHVSAKENDHDAPFPNPSRNFPTPFCVSG